jgi:hypothetical protein
MYAANSYSIRLATDTDAVALQRLFEVAAQPPLEGDVLVAELHGDIVAALGVDDDRAVAEPFRPTAHVVATMRVRAKGLRAVARTPSLRELLLLGLPGAYRAERLRRAA